MALKIVKVIREQTAKILVDVPDDWPDSKAFKIPVQKILNSQVDWATDDTYIDDVESVDSGLTADELFDLDCERTGPNGEAVKVTEADMDRQRGYIEQLRELDGRRYAD